MTEWEAGGGGESRSSGSFATAAKLDTEHLNIISGGEQEKEEEEIRRAHPPRPSSCIITTGNSQRKNSRGKKTLFILSLSLCSSGDSDVRRPPIDSL